MAVTSTDGPSQALDQLQNEVNRVIEQMGRVFVAYNENPKVAPTVQAHKLAQILPGATDNFHAALDQLEHELQLAKLVMRRDLAVCRERSGLAKPPVANGAVPTPAEPSKAEVEPSTTTIMDIDSAPKATEDVQMLDADPESDSKPADAPANNTDQEQTSSDTIKADDTTVEQSGEPTTTADNGQADAKTGDSGMQIDTNTQSKDAADEKPQGDEDNPPDTGTFSNTNDLDSLFGGPTSAGPGDGNGFNNDNTEFDFGFGTDLGDNGGDNDDNITSLLPGLQDYANNQGNENNAADLDNIFDFDNVAGDGGQNEHSFEDLLDFEDFTGGDYGNGDGNNNNNGGDTDFDFSFD